METVENDTLPETNSKSPWNWAIPKGNASSNHPFSGATLVSGRVDILKCLNLGILGGFKKKDTW